MFLRTLHDRILRAPSDEGAGGPELEDDPNKQTDDDADAGDGGEDDPSGGAGKLKEDVKDAKSALDLIDDDEEDKGKATDDDGKGEDGEDDGSPKLVFKEKPDWLPDNFFDAETGEVAVEKLAKANADMRAQISKGWDKAPESWDKYDLDLSEAEKELEALGLIEEDGSPDPVKQGFLELLHSQDVPTAKANAIYKGVLGILADFAPEPIDGKKLIADIGRNGLAVLTNTKRWVTHLEEAQILSKDETDAVRGWLQSATDVRALHKLRSRYNDVETDIPIGETVAEGTKTRSELRAELAELAKEADEGKPGTQEKYDRLLEQYNKTYGIEPAGTSLPG